MSDFKEKKERASEIIDKAMPYLDDEQATAFARTIAGAATMNHMMEQMRNDEPPTILPELAGSTV